MKIPRHKYLLALADFVILNYAFAIAVKAQPKLKINLLLNGPPFAAPEVFFFAGYSIIILFVFFINGLYNIDLYLSVTKQLQVILKSLVYSILGLVLISFITRLDIVESRLVLLYFFFISLSFLVLFRIIFFPAFYKNRLFNFIPQRRVLIIGAEGKGLELAKCINETNPLGLRIIGFLDDKKSNGSLVVNGYEVVGGTSEILKRVNDLNIHEVIFCLEGISEEAYIDLIEESAKSKARILIAADRFSVIPKYVSAEYYCGIPVFGVLNNNPYLGLKALKRVTDIVLASAGLVILSPLFLIIAAAIKLNSRGPVIHKQVRIGKDGLPFLFYKFRSMYLNNGDDTERIEKLRRFIKDGKTENTESMKIVAECHVTRVGKFIRKTSIDELPQLFNVLNGQMSLVGPRPCLPYEWEHYSLWHKKRHSVYPGCTGLWQVLGRSRVPFREMAIMDIYYVYNVSFHLDLWLILKTIPVMLFGIGAK